MVIKASLIALALSFIASMISALSLLTHEENHYELKYILLCTSSTISTVSVVVLIVSVIVKLIMCGV